jgi:4-hydroxy-tetrahydrodipicolinate synthase
MITPCRAPGVIDTEATATLARELTARGCQGLFVPSSTGELAMLDDTDRRRLVAAARRGVGQDRLIYAGVSGMGLKQTQRYANEAAEAGADVALAMAPFFVKLDQRELVSYITALAEASPIPVGIYNHLRMPSGFDVETVAKLAEHPNVVTVKDTTLESQRVAALIEATRGTELALFQGREAELQSSLTQGMTGCVTALAGMAPEWHNELYQAVQRGDSATAGTMQQRIDALTKLFKLDHAGQSFAHFAYMIRRGVQRRGWLKHTAGMVPGFKPEPAFTASIDRIVEESGLLDETRIKRGVHAV